MTNDNIPLILRRDDAFWERAMSVRFARLKRLRELRAPRIIIKNEQLLVYMARHRIAHRDDAPQHLIQLTSLHS